MSTRKFAYGYNIETGEPVTAAPGLSRGQKARLYDKDRDEGRLACPHCLQAKLHFNAGVKTMMGDSGIGFAQHLKTNPGSPHASTCIGKVISGDTYTSREIDPEKGFFIKLSTGDLRKAFDSAALIVRKPGGKWEIRDPDLLDREPLNLNSAAAAIAILQSGDQQRLQTSVVVNGKEKFSLQDLVVRGDNRLGYDRWKNMAERTLAGHHHPYLFHFKTAYASLKERHTHTEGSSMRYALHNFEAVHPDTGQLIKVVPLIKIKNDHLFPLMWDNPEFLVLGEPKLYENNKEPGVWFADICVTDPRMIAPVDLLEVQRKGKENARAFQSLQEKQVERELLPG